MAGVLMDDLTLTWAEWLALFLVVVFVLLPVMAWRWLMAVWLRVTGRWVRAERGLKADRSGQ